MNNLLIVLYIAFSIQYFIDTMKVVKIVYKGPPLIMIIYVVMGAAIWPLSLLIGAYMALHDNYKENKK